MYETGNLAGGAEKAVPEYLRACLLGDGLGCHIAGLKFLLGEGVQRDEQRAARSFDAACTLDYADGCAMKGAMLASERPPRTEEAHALYKKGCRYGGVLGCRLMGEAQQGTESDRREYLGLACARGDSEACGLAKSVSAAPSSSDAPALSAVPPPSAAPAPSRAPAPSASGSAASQLRPPP